MKENQLKPCPFCGGEVTWECVSPMHPSGTYLGKIFCNPCLIEMTGQCENKDELFLQLGKLWNTRHEPKPASKSKGTYEEVAEFCKSIGLPESDAEYFFNKCEGNGWLNGGKKIKDWRATIRSWKAAGYMPSTKHPTVPKTRGGAEPIWVQIKRIQEQVDTHLANPSFRGYRADKVTPEQKEHYENQKANLKRLKGELI